MRLCALGRILCARISIANGSPRLDAVSKSTTLYVFLGSRMPPRASARYTYSIHAIGTCQRRLLLADERERLLVFLAGVRKDGLDVGRQLAVEALSIWCSSIPDVRPPETCRR